MLAVVQVTQSIWLSRGAAYPASLGDGRFNQLVLEHGYQSLRGVYAWDSPAQFFPTAGTLGYSDTHAGTLPIYAVSRLLGYSLDHAWQQWFVIVVGLNAFAAFHLFARLQIQRWLRGPLTFAAVASVTMVWFAGTHPQMLPIFPTLFAWAELIAWSDDRRVPRLLRAAGWFAWQFAAGPYLAFFGLAIAAFVGLVRTVCARGSASRPKLRTGWFGATSVAVAGGTLAVFTALVYRRAMQGGASRSLDEVRELAPRFASWFTAPPVHWLYPAGWPGHMENLAEHAWLSGFLPWLLLPPGIVLGWRTRRTAAGAWLLALSAGALLVALFFTRWGDTGGWIMLAQWIEPLRAFRAGGRIAGLLLIVQLAAAGTLLTWICAHVRRGGWIGVPLALLLVSEGLAFRQPSTEIVVAAKRANAVIAAWRAAGDRPVLAYAFSYMNQPEVYMHLDAWSAALRLKRATLNGYSGNWPGSHLRFLWNATPENAKSLTTSVGLNPADVSIVERVSDADSAALGIEFLPGRQLAHLDDFALQPEFWSLFSYLERHVVDGTTMYQFTPPAEVRFRMPDAAKVVHVLIAFRPDAYTRGRTDGGGFAWSVRIDGGPEQPLAHDLLAPFTREADRGLQPRTLTLPPGRNRLLILRTDAGPTGDSSWDFNLVGQLRVE